MPRNGGAKLPRDGLPISPSEVSPLFAGLNGEPAIVLAVSGGPDSMALMWLAAQWRKRLKRGPKLVAATVDHGLRKEAATEARAVKKLAASLGIAHTTLRWSGAKPSSGILAAAREARYSLLAKVAHRTGATRILTAHTLDDQAETFLMRLSRGSGLAGLAAMARHSVRGEVVVVRPLLNVSKARLIATLDRARISFASDPTNQDTAFARPRWRKLMPELAQEGIDARNIARLVVRLARANEALDAVADRAEAALVRVDGSRQTVDAKGFLTLPDEVMLRVLHRAVERVGYEGPAELGKVEILLDDVVGALAANKRVRRTLAGALIDVGGGTIGIEPAPPRRKRRS